MTSRTAAQPTARPLMTTFARAAVRLLSDRVHAKSDDHARAHGWDIADIPGPLGLAGRRYHDPRFAARRQDAATRNGGSA